MEDHLILVLKYIFSLFYRRSRFHSFYNTQINVTILDMGILRQCFRFETSTGIRGKSFQKMVLLNKYISLKNGEKTYIQEVTCANKYT